MNKKKNLSLPQTRLLRRLLDLAFVHGNDTELFYRKFMETVNIGSLKSHDIIALEELALTPNECDELKNAHLTKTEVEMCSLEKQGFSPQELTVMYGAKGVTTIYVRKHRISKKLKGSCEPEILIVMTAMLVIALVLMRVLGIG